MAASAKELPTAITAYEAIDEVSNTITNVYSTYPHKIMFMGKFLVYSETPLLQTPYTFVTVLISKVSLIQV